MVEEFYSPSGALSASPSVGFSVTEQPNLAPELQHRQGAADLPRYVLVGIVLVPINHDLRPGAVDTYIKSSLRKAQDGSAQLNIHHLSPLSQGPGYPNFAGVSRPGDGERWAG